MGTFHIERWRCDRCGVEHDKRPPPSFPMHSITASQHNEWAGGALISWKEMCAECNREVEKLLPLIFYNPIARAE